MRASQISKLSCRDRSGRRFHLYLPSWPGERIATGRSIAGLYLARARQMAWPSWQRWRLFERGQRCTRLRIDFLWRLGLLLKSGVNLSEALAQLAEAGGPPMMRSCIVGLLLDLNQGKSFAQALERHDWLFPRRTLSLLRQAEKTGELDKILDKIIANDEWMLVSSGKIMRALTYPAIVIVLVCAIAMIMLFFVVPSFAQLLIDSGKMDPEQPPWWWTLSLWASQNEVWMSAAVAAAIGAALIWQGRHRLILLLPATKKLHHSRQMHLFEFLYEAGVHLPEIIKALSEGEASRKDRRRWRGIAEKLRQGSSLGEALRDLALLPPLVVALLRAGEGCGRIGYAAGQAGLCLEREANEQMESFQQWLTPVCLLVMGGLMAWLFSGLTSLLYDFGTSQ